MVTKEQIKAEIDNLNESDLEELHQLIQDFVRVRVETKSESFMSRMRKIKIEASEDFSVNWQEYANGEKLIE